MLKLKKYGKKILLAILVILLCISSAISITLLGKTKNNGVVFASEPEQKKAVIYKTTGLTTSNTESLSTEVALTRGGAELEDGGIVYEGEYIKYNFRLTNKTQANIDNVKIVASIPDGVKYGELNSNFEEFRQSYFYNFDEELTEKIIEVGTIEAGQSKEIFYEVKVKDLPEGEIEKEIVANVNSYIGEELAQSYQLRNVINSADTQLFLGSFTQYGGKQYGLNIKSDTQEEVEVKIHFPQNFKLSFITYMVDEFEDIDRFDSQIDGGKIVYTNVEGQERKEYTIEDLKEMLGEEDFNKLQELEKIEGIEDVKEVEGLRLKDILEMINNTNTLGEVVISEDNILTAKLKTNHCYRFLGVLDASKISGTSENSKEYVTAYAETSDSVYMSNENRIEAAYKNIEVTMISNNAGKKVKYNEDIEYEIKIKNIGKGLTEDNLEISDYIQVNVVDFLPEEIKPESVIYNNWEFVENPNKQEDKKILIQKVDDAILSVSGKRRDEEGNILADVDVPIIIPQGETANIKIKAKAGFVYEETTVENVVTVKSDEMIQNKISNKISHTILPYNYQNSSVPDVPDNPDIPDIPDVPDVPDNPEDPNRPNTPNVPDRPNNEDKEQIKKEFCDFKIDKYISKVTVKTESGVKEYNYNNENLAKVEIKAKEINGAVVTVDYKIVVTNEGNVAGTIGEISDNLPKGFAISNESNKNWPRNSKGEFVNKSKANLKIEPGESTTLTISATKKMTSDTVGNFKNEVAIKNVLSITGLQDANSQNDTSNAELIISISTGIYVYIAIIISILAVLSSIAIYLTKKGKLRIGKFGKTTFLAIAFIATIVTHISQAADNVYFTPQTTHSWSSDIGTAYCEDGTILSDERYMVS